MWDRSLLKYNAQEALRGKWLPCIAVCLLCGIINLIVNIRKETLAVLPNIFGLGSDFLALSYPPFIIIFLVLTVFVMNVLDVGRCRYFMENRQGNAPVSTLFSVFQYSYLNIVWVQFIVSLKIALGYILFIIPGIVWSYRYSLVPYLLAEDPQMDYRRAMELSRTLMHGEKINLFILQLSFIGWHLLCLVTLSVGYIFLNPYIEATTAEFYAAMRAKAFSMGIASSSELGGFYTY